MRNQWFIVQTLSGQEQKVKDSIEKRVKTDEMQDFVKEVLVRWKKSSKCATKRKPSRAANCGRATFLWTWFCWMKTTASSRSRGISSRKRRA